MGAGQAFSRAAVDAWRHRIREETFANYHYEMGIALEREGNVQEAALAYRRALNTLPGHGSAGYRLMRLLEQAGDFTAKEAVKSSLRALDENFEEKAQIEAGMRLLESGETREALNVFAIAHDNNPENKNIAICVDLALFLNGEKSGIDSSIWNGDAEEFVTPLAAEICLKVAHKYLSNNKRRSARIIFLAAHKISPQILESIRYLSIIDYDDGNFSSVVSFLKENWVHIRQDIDCLDRLGDALFQCDRVAEAEVVFKSLCEIGPEYPENWLKLGNAFWGLGKAANAETAYRRSVRAQSKAAAPHPYVNLAQTLLAQNRGAEAESFLRTAIELAPNDGGNYVHLGSSLFISGRPAAAEEALLEACARMRESAWPVAWIGLARLGTGDVEGARNALARAASLDPTSGWFQSIEALFEHVEGRYEESVVRQEAALSSDGGSAWSRAWIRGNSVATLLKLGKTRAAEEAAEDAARCAPVWFPYQQRIRPSWAREALETCLGNKKADK